MTNITQHKNQWRVSGDLLMDNANATLSQSHELLMTNPIEIDFSAVTDVDTAAVSLIMEWQRRAIASNCKVTFTNLPADLTSLAALYGVTEFIPISTN
ncbi:MAG: STAS domain-containing protein [Methylotenera sp.]